AGGGFGVGAAGPVFEDAFGHFEAVRVDAGVERRARRGERARRFGFDRGLDGRARGFEGFVCAFRGPAGVLGDDAEVVGGVFGEAADRRGDRHVRGPRAGRRRAGGGFGVGAAGPLFYAAFGRSEAVRVDAGVERRARRGERARRFGFDRGL